MLASRRVVGMALAVVSLGGLAACSDDDGGALPPARSSTTSSSTTTSTATTTTTTGGSTGAFEGGTTTVSVPAPEVEPRLLTAVRVADQGNFDRVVFEFRNGLPGYVVEYVTKPVHQDGSGAPVATAGSAALLVRLTPASGVDLTTGDATPTYTGPNRVAGTGAGGSVAEVVKAGDFEAVLTWAIGVRPSGRTPFKVSTLTAPPRVVVDVGR